MDLYGIEKPSQSLLMAVEAHSSEIQAWIHNVSYGIYRAAIASRLDYLCITSSYFLNEPNSLFLKGPQVTGNPVLASLISHSL